MTIDKDDSHNNSTVSFSGSTGVVGGADNGVVALRKKTPVYSGFIKYFPLAAQEVARLSLIANEQHNPGTELHWDRSKSGDELDALMRHLCDHAKGNERDTDGVLHLAKVAWRGMAALEKLLEQHGQ